MENLQRRKPLYCKIADIQFSTASNSAMKIRRKPDIMDIWQYILLHSVVKRLKTNKKVKVIFYQCFPISEGALLFWNVPRLRLFVLLLRETRVRRQLWSNGGMIMARKTESLGGKPVPAPPCPPQISQELAWNRTSVSAVTGRGLTSWNIARYLKLIPSVPHSKHIPSLLLKPVS